MAESTALRDKIRRALNCLVAQAIADPHEIIENTREILEGKDLDRLLLFVHAIEKDGVPGGRLAHEAVSALTNAGYMDETLGDHASGPGKRKRWKLNPAGETRIRELCET